MTTDKLAELRRLHEAAAEVPWELHDQQLRPKGGSVYEIISDSCDGYYFVDFASAELIIAARNALPALLRIAEAARMVTTYGGHYAYCASVVGVTNCDCGYLELRAALAELEKP